MKARTALITASAGRKRPLEWRSMIGFVCSALLASGCHDSITEPPMDVPFERPEAEVGGSMTGAAAKFVFQNIATGVTRGAGEQLFGWTMGALGLAQGGPDYTEQLDRIDEHLQVMIDELNGIQAELNSINGVLTVLNCTNWATALTTEKARVDNLLWDYQSFASTAASGGTVSASTISDWVDQVEAQGSYSSHESMGDIIATFINTLTVPGNTGVIPACVQAIARPADEAMSVDDDYYAQVQLFTNYYYNYQVRALFLYVEAKHYRAWLAAGSPNSSTLSADSIPEVCSNASAALYCNQAAQRTNEVYNALVAQITTAGAPYSSEYFVLKYDTDYPVLIPLSLEAISNKLDGNACPHPLTSANPCGELVGLYNNLDFAGHLKYAGYTDWTTATIGTLDHMLDGWKTGTAGEFLENNYGFQNMKDKIILSRSAISISLDYTGYIQKVVGFFDTDMEKGPTNGGFNTQTEFETRLTKRSKHAGAVCDWRFNRFTSYDWEEAADLPDNVASYPERRNDFYNFSGHARKCGDSEWTTPFAFKDTWPGWVIEMGSESNPYTDKMRQFRWPVVSVRDLNCTEGRSPTNTNGVWTMCGDNFTVWLDDYVPRPASCDLAAAGVECVLDATTIANARSATEI